MSSLWSTISARDILMACAVKACLLRVRQHGYHDCAATRPNRKATVIDRVPFNLYASIYGRLLPFVLRTIHYWRQSWTQARWLFTSICWSIIAVRSTVHLRRVSVLKIKTRVLFLTYFYFCRSPVLLCLAGRENNIPICQTVRAAIVFMIR